MAKLVDAMDSKSISSHSQALTDKDLQQSKIAGCAPRRAPECADPHISAESGVEISSEITTESTPETVLNPRRVDDPQLSKLMTLWYELTPTVRECVLAMVEGSVRMEQLKHK